MHILLTGSTGYIGSEVLRQALASPAITHVTTLSRKPLDIKDAKLTSIVHADFTQYPDTLISQLKESPGGSIGACVWALGLAMPPSKEVGQLVNYDYTLAGANALKDAFATSGSESPFRFVYVSGGLVERDQDKRLWLLSATRKFRGKVELDVLALNQPGAFDALVARPTGIPRSEANARMKDKLLVGVATLTGLPYIRLDVLGAALLSLGVNGYSKAHSGVQGVVENDDLKNLGAEAITATGKASNS